MGFENLLLGFQIAITPFNLFVAVVGILLGTIIGVLPGLGGANGVAILLARDFHHATDLGNHSSDFDLLGRAFRRGHHFDTVSTSPASLGRWRRLSTATQWRDKAQGGQALTAAFTSSFIGAFFSIVLITFFAPAAR